MMSLFDEEQIMKSFIKSERYEAAQENARTTAERMIKAEKFTLEEIAGYEVFSTPEEMAESLLRNWRWQWFYKNRDSLPRKDYNDICELDNEALDELQEQYHQELRSWQDKIHTILHSR